MQHFAPPRVDILVAAAVAALALAEVFADPLKPYAASIPLELVQAGAVAFRRRAPVAAVVVATSALFVETATGVSLHTPVSPIVVGLITVYSVAQYEPLPPAAAGLVFALCGVLGAIQLARANGESYAAGDQTFVAVFIVAPWIVGRALYGRTREAAEHAERATRLERERELVVEEERARIARELHDVISHSLSVIVVQAGAAERIGAAQPERSQDALRSIQETGRQALVEMSRLVGVLRGGEEIGLEAQPGLDRVESLVEETRKAGLPVELHVEGRPRRLPPALDLSAYRIVQEALTNARKHAGDASARVTLRYGEQELAIEVADDGRGVNGHEPHIGGHGLIGMSERAAVFGGTLAAGPREDGGFVVRAMLPIDGTIA